ncbi:cellulose biosynthesis protein BcsO [Dickeya solani]|uniref:Cellulose biosynthesis protein BcsO n=1 Tax=Dickeya solani TaxID=1089444 RepID=A0ABU4EJ43_9GAMM|nr:cellulose biosynthesis protein BcsO [Dickeya solani]MCA7000876.1 cellulose biosynthesis protein BcsO [Dickeya solani]MCZ0821782.1 cellulose biosynthesis protein BcsO [Dickeya solani]MDV6994961.1 cellulose biosynthesis protein BcsO [Dickeya solani]MDV7006382.1 cellulose biosynthesis protein BcsO [Dickeya solani]MDV7036881.1 cellulose biosynthesis protein BcsO [Dickeya solani]
MKSYDDMQRFKDKAQIKDINFKDMSGQVLQSETVVWPIMKQLLRNQTGDDTLSGAQPVSITQPVPVSQHVLSAPESPSSPSRRVMPSSGLNADPFGGNQHSLFNAIAASLPPADTVSAPVPQPVAPPTPVSQPQPAALTMETVPPATARPHLLASAPAVSEASAASEAGRFRQLFSRHHHDEIHSVSKTMLLKPLLEKIALCR